MDRKEKAENILKVAERIERGPLPLSDDGEVTVERRSTGVLVKNRRKRGKL